MFIEMVLQVNWTFLQMNNLRLYVWSFDLIYSLKHMLIPSTSTNRIYEKDFQQIDLLTASSQAEKVYKT
jgi:hypothetical protein